jgi:hypothetical protein
MISYSTTDLYIAAALIVCSGNPPDEYTVSHDLDKAIVNCTWNNRTAVEPHASNAKSNQLTVDIVKLREAHLELKRRVREILKNEKEKD